MYRVVRRVPRGRTQGSQNGMTWLVLWFGFVGLLCVLSILDPNPLSQTILR